MTIASGVRIGRLPCRSLTGSAAGRWISAILAPVVTVLLAAAPAAQRARPGGRMVLGAIEKEAGAQDAELGVPVRLFESPNLDRFLRRAHEFLAREDFGGAIKVLQDVLEGRTLVAAESESPDSPGARDTSSSNRPKEPKSALDEDPKLAVFSSDDRLFRPVRRLCHERLAEMPVTGRSLYRERFEVAARQAYEQAWRARDASALQVVADRYFVTLAAGRALMRAGDLRMHEGRFRAAILFFRTLLDIYPEDQRRLIAGLSDAAIETKVAVCHGLLGEFDRCRAVLDTLAEQFPEETVRLLGELVAVPKLGESEFFRPAMQAVSVGAPAVESSTTRIVGDDLVPLWEYRFEDSDPYRGARASSTNRQVVWTNGTGTRMAGPQVAIGGPGGLPRFDGSRLLFFENARLHIRDVRSGMVRAFTDGSTRATPPTAGQPRQRVPVYDHATMRPRFDADRYYAVISPRLSAGSGLKVVLSNQLVAYDRKSLDRVWDTGVTNGVTFLAAPTVFGKRLFVPTLINDAVAMDCRSAATGKLEFRVWLHSGGSEFSRPVAVPVAVHMGVAYVATNAGVLAAIDAFSGELMWLRRYERLHPLRSRGRFRRRSRAANPFGMARFYREVGFAGFLPSDLVTVDGRVILAPADGKVLLCLDGATGEILWLHSKRAGESERHIVGHNSKSLFVSGSSQMICIDLRSGLRRWATPLPVSRYTGRGVVTESMVITPGKRSVHILDLKADSPTWRRVELPAFSVGRVPLESPANLALDGAFLTATYAGGIEVFGSVAGLRRLAEQSRDPRERAHYALQAGDLVDAIDAYEDFLRDESQPVEDRARVARRTIEVARDVALALAVNGDKAAAMATVERVEPLATMHGLEARLLLTRVELYRELGENATADAELEKLNRSAAVEAPAGGEKPDGGEESDG